MADGEFKRAGYSRYLDKATEHARNCERTQPPWLRNHQRNQAQSWRNLRWQWWDESNRSRWTQ